MPWWYCSVPKIQLVFRGLTDNIDCSDVLLMSKYSLSEFDELCIRCDDVGLLCAVSWDGSSLPGIPVWPRAKMSPMDG